MCYRHDIRQIGYIVTMTSVTIGIIMGFLMINCNFEQNLDCPIYVTILYTFIIVIMAGLSTYLYCQIKLNRNMEDQLSRVNLLLQL